jgi:hypothetical protein
MIKFGRACVEEERLSFTGCDRLKHSFGGAVAQLGARLDGIEEVVGSNPIGSTNIDFLFNHLQQILRGTKPLWQPTPRAPLCRALRVCLRP